jgi:hypothetical protein
MVTGALLTVLSILLAAYSMQPEEKRIDLKIRISLINIFYVLALILAILIVIYSPVILSITQMRPIPWLWGFTEELASFTYLFAIILFSFWKMRGSRVPSINYGLWASESDLLLREHKFSQLGYLLNKYHKQLFSVNNEDTWLFKLRKNIAPPVKFRKLIFPASQEIVEVDSGIKALFTSIWHALRAWIVKPIPTDSIKQDVIKRSFAKLFKSRLFVTYLAGAYPMVGAQATQLRFRDDGEYRKYYFEALINNPHSALYRELRDSQSIPVNGKYYIEPSNQILSYLLLDANVAKDISAWKPIGDWIREYIQQGERSDYYNQSCGYFSQNDERWECPVYVGGHFFNVMVTAAICQRVDDHMWLLYLERFIEDILDQINRADDVDLASEFPTRYDYLLYYLFSVCDDWLGIIEYLDYEDVSHDDKLQFPEHWAARSFGCMLRKVLLSRSVTKDQKAYFLEIAIKRIKHLDRNGLDYYSDLILDGYLRTHAHGTIIDQVVSELGLAYRDVDELLVYGDYSFRSLMERKSVEV